MSKTVRRLAACAGLILMAMSLSGCIVYDGHHGGCYHWWRC